MVMIWILIAQLFAEGLDGLCPLRAKCVSVVEWVGGPMSFRLVAVNATKVDLEVRSTPGVCPLYVYNLDGLTPKERKSDLAFDLKASTGGFPKDVTNTVPVNEGFSEVLPLHRCAIDGVRFPCRFHVVWPIAYRLKGGTVDARWRVVRIHVDMTCKPIIPTADQRQRFSAEMNEQLRKPSLTLAERRDWVQIASHTDKAEFVPALLRSADLDDPSEAASAIESIIERAKLSADEPAKILAEQGLLSAKVFLPWSRGAFSPPSAKALRSLSSSADPWVQILAWACLTELVEDRPKAVDSIGDLLRLRPSKECEARLRQLDAVGADERGRALEALLSSDEDVEAMLLHMMEGSSEQKRKKYVTLLDELSKRGRPSPSLRAVWALREISGDRSRLLLEAIAHGPVGHRATAAASEFIRDR